MLLGVDGRSDFNGLYSRRARSRGRVLCLDMLVSDGEDLRKLPLFMRKANLAQLYSTTPPARPINCQLPPEVLTWRGKERRRAGYQMPWPH